MKTFLSICMMLFTVALFAQVKPDSVWTETNGDGDIFLVRRTYDANDGYTQRRQFVGDATAADEAVNRLVTEIANSTTKVVGTENQLLQAQVEANGVLVGADQTINSLNGSSLDAEMAAKHGGALLGKWRFIDTENSTDGIYEVIKLPNGMLRLQPEGGGQQVILKPYGPAMFSIINLGGRDLTLGLRYTSNAGLRTFATYDLLVQLIEQPEAETGQ